MGGDRGRGGGARQLGGDLGEQVLARDGIVLNPHYQGMGGLYGSEYWTYSLPKRVGAEKAQELTERCLPVSVQEARAIGLIDDVILQDHPGESAFGGFREQIARIAEGLARSPHYASWLEHKRAGRAQDERVKPLQQYRADELAEMKKNFWGEDRGYHLARAAFVRKQPRGGELKWPAALEAVGGHERRAQAGRSVAGGWAPAHAGRSASGARRHAA